MSEFVKWRRDSGDWVGQTSQDRSHFRILRRKHGIYLVRPNDIHDKCSSTKSAKETADNLARLFNCVPLLAS